MLELKQKEAKVREAIEILMLRDWEHDEIKELTEDLPNEVIQDKLGDYYRGGNQFLRALIGEPEANRLVAIRRGYHVVRKLNLLWLTEYFLLHVVRTDRSHILHLNELKWLLDTVEKNSCERFKASVRGIVDTRAA